MAVYYWTGEKGSTNSIASGGNGFGNSSNQWYGCNGAGVSDPGNGGTLNGAGANPTYYGSSYESASFGYGGSMDFYHTDIWQYEAAGAGGDGHYGGATGGTISGLVSTGSGGSGFVSGASGCVAISGYRNSSDVTQVQYNSVSYKCTTSSLINGENSLPKSSGLYKASYESSDMETGHTGNGFARITRFQILDY